MELFKDILRNLRKKHGFTQADLAEKIGIDRTVVSDWENNVKMPHYKHLVALADIFVITIDELTGHNAIDEIAITEDCNLKQKPVASGKITIADLREASGTSQAELTKILGVSRNTLTNWETKGMPNFQTYKKLFQYFNLTLEAIYSLK